MTIVDETDRPDPMMDLLVDHAIRAARPVRVARIPNRRALAVLDDMFAYYDHAPVVETVDLSYDHAA